MLFLGTGLLALSCWPSYYVAVLTAALVVPRSSPSYSGSSHLTDSTPAGKFASPSTRTTTTLLGISSRFDGDDDEENEADQMKRKAEELREQIRKMEEQLDDRRKERGILLNENRPAGGDDDDDASGEMSLKGRRVLVAGANGRLGSMVCRYLLRNYPGVEVVAAVHYVGENSPTARGYGRLSYEVGAEDGIGSIGPAWSPEERTATFQFDVETMTEYNLQNLRIVECELLDPVQCRSVCEGCDAVIWCATDFNENRPRAISGLNVAFLFRAAANPDKGRVEVEGLQNMLGAIKQARQDKERSAAISKSSARRGKDPVNFVLVSSSPQAFENFETPFGEYNAIKRQGEEMMRQDFPSLTSTVVQLPRFEDNFVDEGLEIMKEDVSSSSSAAAAAAAAATDREKALRKINRRDAAKAAVDALVDEDYVGKVVQVWTSPSR